MNVYLIVALLIFGAGVVWVFVATHLHNVAIALEMGKRGDRYVHSTVVLIHGVVWWKRIIIGIAVQAVAWAVWLSWYLTTGG